MFASLSLFEGLLLFATGYSLAYVIAYVILNRIHSPRALAITLNALLYSLLILPLFIPPEHRVIRFFSFLPLFNFSIRNFDLMTQARVNPAYAISFINYIRFTTAGFGVENPLAAPGEIPNRRIREGMSRIFFGLVKFAYVLALVGANTYFRTIEWAYWVSVFCKIHYFYVFADAMMDVYFGFYLFAGKNVSSIYKEPILARSPADFWTNRVNLFVGQSLFRFVYIPVGLRFGADIGILSAFLFSGFLHEYQFDVSSTAITGHLLAFFALQGFAVAAEMRGKRIVRRRWTNFYKKASQNRVLPYLTIPLQLAFLILTAEIALRSFDMVIEMHDLDLIKNIIHFLGIPPFPW